ncbi:MgtC/SapB family protein [Aquabacter spiritensis]|uniref:Protein MgtC n=1 Tax=Aquabacter spiritensis TaxID=933073 RepID=A0A4R3LMQ9_9HYPH|nr:MgtC/SapB family protein [Aquabacter spiritensis]TCT01602.1 putative Mg2+ transporter-C (MgtC) family protein [Aquabacter spiritensis]
MPLYPDWTDLGLRLLCTFLGCGVIGLDREWQERAAGLRTTILVGIAACITMISANLLLPLDGKGSTSFSEIDVMRLPLGVLTGMGFIGAGAIIRRDGLVRGVTTAATLWFVSILGLCFGAGQFLLGGAGFAVGIFTLWGLKYAERFVLREREATLTLVLGADGPSEDGIETILNEEDVRVRRLTVSYEPGTGRREYRFSLWSGSPELSRPPPLVERLRLTPGVERLDWTM